MWACPNGSDISCRRPPPNLAFETRVQFPLERIVVNRQYDLRALEDRIVGERIAQVYRNDGREPTVGNARYPGSSGAS